MGNLLQLFGHVWRDGNDEFSPCQCLEGFRTQAVRFRLDAAEENVGLERRLQHLGSVPAVPVEHLAASLAMRHASGKIGAGAIAALGQFAEHRSRQLCDATGQGPQVGILRMTQRQCAQPHRAPGSGQQRRRHGLMRIAHRCGAGQ